MYIIIVVAFSFTYNIPKFFEFETVYGRVDPNNSSRYKTAIANLYLGSDTNDKV